MTWQAAQPIGPESWLHEPRFARLRHALTYAGRKTKAIPALSKITPEEAGHLFLIMRNGWDHYERADHREGGAGFVSDDREPPSCSVMGFFRHPDYPGTEVHPSCGYTWHEHGWIDSRDITVCPSVRGPFPGQTICESGKGR